MNSKQLLLNKFVGMVDPELPLLQKIPNVNQYLDSTLLKPSTTPSQIADLCEKAVKHNFRSVRVPPNFVSQSREILSGMSNHNVLVGTVISFPFGYDSIESKKASIVKAFLDGADECDVVLSHLIKTSGHIFEEILEYKDIASKVNIMPILEIEHFDDKMPSFENFLRDLRGIPFITHIKTSSGINVRPTTTEDIQFLKNENGTRFKIKASGGISTLEMALKMIHAGADIIGTSKAEEIALEYEAKKRELESKQLSVEYTIKLHDSKLS